LTPDPQCERILVQTSINERHVMKEITVVRWARPSTKAASESGWRPAIVKPGHKWLSMVHFTESGVSVSKIPLDEEKYFHELNYRGHPYPVQRAARLMLRLRKGRITKEAKAILREALNG
jgi:hypothetical protein